jgi:hypothetical protein
MVQATSAFALMEDIVPRMPDPVDHDDLHRLIEWTQTWYEKAVAAKFVSHPYQADNEVVTRLRQYYRAGLTPEEALHAYFGVKH